MKRRLPAIAIFLLAGTVVNVAVAWVCSAVVKPATKSIRFIAERVDSPAIRDFWLVHEAVGLGVRYVAYVPTDATAWRALGLEVEDDLPDHGSWAPWPPVPRPAIRETSLFVAAGWPLGAVVASCSDYDSRWHVLRASATWVRLKQLWPEAQPARVGPATWSRAVVLQRQDGPFTARVLPFGLNLRGFAINTLFYAIMLWLLLPGPFALRRLIRRRRGRCPACGYDLRHGEHEACPECGVTA